MTLYEILHLLNDYMESKEEKLYDFLLYGCGDYGGFLRTQATRRTEPLPDREIGIFKYVILAVRFRFKHKDCGFDIWNAPKSLMQVYWAKNGYEVLKLVELNKNLGFGDCYVFPLREVQENDC